LPPTIAAMDPTPRSFEQTAVGANTRIGHTAITPPPAAPRRMSRRGLLLGAAAIGATAVTGGGVAAYLGRRAAAELPVVPAAVPSTSSATPTAAPAEAVAKWTFSDLPSSGNILAGVNLLVVADGVLYVGGAGGAVAIDAQTGTQRWRFTAPPGGTGISPDAVDLAVADGTVYVATRGMLTALDLSNGVRRWEIPLQATTAYGSSVGIGVNAGGGSAYATIGNRIVALDGEGRTRWEHTVEGNFAASPVLDGNRCLVADGANIDALDAATANVLWRYRTGAENAADLAVADGVVYMGTNGRTLAAG
jgi:outer membrane protein assembly factor BamB